jgi:O-antigen/teichoic acid export membrane protein
MQRARILSALTGSFAAEAINRLVPLIILHVVVRRIGVSASGLAEFSYNLIDVGVYFIFLGYTSVAQLELGPVRDDKRRVGEIIGEVLALKLIHAVIALVAVLAIVALHPAYGKYQPFVWALSVVLVSTAFDLSYVHIGTSRMLSLAMLTIVVKLMSLFSAVAFVHGPQDAVLYAVLTFGANSILAMANFFLNIRQFPVVWPDRAALVRRFKASLPFALTVLLLMGLERYDLFIIERLLGEHGAGLYAGPLRLVRALVQVAGVISTVFVGELVATKSQEDFTRHVNAGLWAMYAVLAPVCVASFFMGSSILSLVISPDFAEQGGTFGILCCVVLAHCLIQVYGMQVLIFRRRGVALNVVLALAIALGVGVAWPLSAAFGIPGVALANLISRSGAAVALALTARAYVDRLPWREASMTVAPALGMGVTLYVFRPETLGPALVIAAFAYVGLFALSNRQRLANLALTLRERRRA